MNKKQIFYIIAMIILTVAVLLSDRIQPISKTDYIVDYYKVALQLFCKLILPCLLGSTVAQVSAQWIKAEGLSAFKKYKYFIYILIEILAAYILFMLYPIIAIIVQAGLPTPIINYMTFAAENLYLYIIIYFLITLGIIKVCKS